MAFLHRDNAQAWFYDKQRWWRTPPEQWLDAGSQLGQADLADVGRRLSDESLGGHTTRRGTYKA